MSIQVVNIGDGACTVLRTFRETMLIDCGAHDDKTGTRSADRLASVLGSAPQGLNAIVVSHFDADHWRGLAELPQRIAPVGPIRLIYPRLPDSARPVAPMIAALLSVMDGAAPHVNALKLRDEWKRVASQVRSYAYRRGNRFHAVGKTWTVHWPPTEVSGTWSTLFERVRREVAEAAEKWPDLRRALRDAFAAVEETPLEVDDDFDDFEGRLTDIPEEADGESDAWAGSRVTKDTIPEANEAEPTFSAAPDELRDKMPGLYRDLQRLNNSLSLVISDDEHELLAMGDVEGWGLRRLLLTNDFSNRGFHTILAPHHGTVAPKPAEAPLFPFSGTTVAQTGAEREKGREAWLHRATFRVHSTYLDGDYVTHPRFST